MAVGQGRSALVLYGTETGTSQDLAEELGQILERQLFDIYIQSLDAVHPVRYPQVYHDFSSDLYSKDTLSSFTLSIFVVATTGQGDFPSNARVFWTNLLRKRLGPDYLANVNFALVGLGDTSYPK